MKRIWGHSWVIGGLMVAGSGGVGLGQYPPLPPEPAPIEGSDLGGGAHQLTEATQQLAGEVEAALRGTPAGQDLVRGARELARKAREFNDAQFAQQLRSRPDPVGLRRAFAAVMRDWDGLKDQLAQPGLSTPSIDRIARRVDQLEMQVARTVGLAGPPQPRQEVPGRQLAEEPVGDPLNDLAHQMAEQVGVLADRIAADLGDTPSGRYLVGDARELGQAIAEFHETLHGSRDPYRIRQTYAGLDASWHQLQAQLARPGTATPGINQAARGVEQIEGQLHQHLGLDAPPPDLYAATDPPAGPAEARRLAHAMAERSRDLAHVIQAEMRDIPEGQRLARDAALLVRESSELSRRLAQGPPPPDLAREFGPVVEVCDRLGPVLNGPGIPPRVASAWQGLVSTDVLVRQQVGLPVAPPATVHVVLRPVGGGPSPAIALSEQLLGQVDAFLQAFAPTAHNVPQGESMLVDAQRLREAALAFRDQAARGPDPGRLAFAFRDVDASWNRLSRRINRVARGRIGPNIQVALQMGETCRQLHQILGMPGYVPILQLP